MSENPYEEALENIDKRATEKLMEFELQRDAWDEGSEFVLKLLEKAKNEGIDSLSDEGIEGKVKSFLTETHNQAMEDAVEDFKSDEGFFYPEFIRNALNALKKEAKE